MSKRGARNSANVKPGQFNPDPESQLEVQRQESDAHLAAQGSSTGISLKWFHLGRLKIPVGLKIGISLGGRFGPKSKPKLSNPLEDKPIWDSETGTFRKPQD